jgi:hypothetical protein
MKKFRVVGVPRRDRSVEAYAAALEEKLNELSGAYTLELFNAQNEVLIIGRRRSETKQAGLSADPLTIEALSQAQEQGPLVLDAKSREITEVLLQFVADGQPDDQFEKTVKQYSLLELNTASDQLEAEIALHELVHPVSKCDFSAALRSVKDCIRRARQYFQ